MTSRKKKRSMKEEKVVVNNRFQTMRKRQKEHGIL